MEGVIVVGLGQERANGKVGGVGFNPEGSVGSGWINTRAKKKAALRESKALCVAGFQRDGVSFRVSWMRGCTREENPSINR